MFLHFVSGISSTRLITEHVPHVKCTSCLKNDVMISVNGRYAHILWIPLFPIRKRGTSECLNCGKKLEKDEFLNAYRDVYNELKNKTGFKPWHFSGSVIIILLAIYLYPILQTHKKETELYIQAPLAGDLYTYKTDEGKSYIKVTSVTKDSIFVRYNKFFEKSILKLVLLDKEENYKKEIVGFSKKDLVKMHKDGYIYGVSRINK